MNKKKILFICEHNSARSQMAEAFMKKYAGHLLDVASAGFEPRPLNPLAVAAMKDAGIDISGQKAQSVFELFKAGKTFSYVITVCDDTAKKCPVFPGTTQRLHWPFDDPARFQGSWDMKLEKTRAVRDQIEMQVKNWLESNREKIESPDEPATEPPEFKTGL